MVRGSIKAFKCKPNKGPDDDELVIVPDREIRKGYVRIGALKQLDRREKIVKRLLVGN
jgi:hypothetical protein